MRNKLFAFFIIFLFSCTSIRNSFSQCDFPKNSPFPGGVINYPLNYSSFTEPKVRINKEVPYFCQKNKDEWRIIHPISLLENQNSIDIFLNKKLINKITLERKEYRESKIFLKNKEMISPPPESLKRIKSESSLIKDALKVNSLIKQPSLKMVLPCEGVISSEFGVKRFINNQPRNRHVGLDIAAREGTKVKAALKGKVILTGEFYFAGKVIFIDHGKGLISSYSHLNSVNVKKGQMVNKNKTIGLVGKTGRVTGAHLHWQTFIKGIPVNPELFLE
tara:strand:+ start:4313 stop:5140 length:828 start_codon:yes stop_codon:yes gene_type:complete